VEIVYGKLGTKLYSALIREKDLEEAMKAFLNKSTDIRKLLTLV